MTRLTWLARLVLRALAGERLHAIGSYLQQAATWAEYLPGGSKTDEMAQASMPAHEAADELRGELARLRALVQQLTDGA